MDQLTTLNDNELLEIRDNYFFKLKQIFAGEKLDENFYLAGIWAETDVNGYNEPEKWVEKALIDLAQKADKLRDQEVFRPLCIEFGLYGVHFIDRIFGANVFFDEDSNQWYNDPLDIQVGELEYPDLENNETWDLARRIAKDFKKYEVKLPLFGLTTIASTLNVAVNLYGEKILMAMELEPEKVLHDFRIINKLLSDLHKWYQNNIPLDQLQPVVSFQRTQPPGYGQLCGCTTQLISANSYREMVAYFDDQLLSVYPRGGMIHLCGSHTQHIETWRDIESFRAFQLNDRAAEDLEIYYHKLRDDQIIYLNPCPKMTVEKALEITNGDRLIIVK